MNQSSRAGPQIAMEMAYPQQQSTYSGNVATEFHFFALLPAEIRTKIWNEAYNDESNDKVIEMKHSDFYANDTPQDRKAYQDNISDHRNLLGACVESRVLVKKDLITLRLGPNQQVLMNPNRDIIYFGPSSCLPRWEILEQVDAGTPRFQIEPNTADISHRLRNNQIRGLHPFLAANRRQINRGGRKKVVKVAICQDLLLRAKQQGIFQQLLDNFPACKGLLVVAGDMGEKQTKRDHYQLLDSPAEWEPVNPVALAPTDDDYFLCQRHFVSPRIEHKIKGDRTTCLAQPISCLGEITLQYCPPHLQQTTELLSVKYRQNGVRYRHRKITHYGLARIKKHATAQQILAHYQRVRAADVRPEKTWSVMTVHRGGQYHGHPNRMDWWLK